MDHKTTCVILRKIPYREKSLIVHTLTRECGRIDLVLKGGRNVSARHFPSAELFRLFSLEFTQRDPGPRASSSDLYAPRVMEYAGNFDAVALHTENYLSLCEYASFLLKHTVSFLAVPQTFDSLLVLLDRFAQ
ncbi:MAG: recombination protein O N-terminal domain-containing protein, partial [Lentisphaeria bacterium]|nr:recombination protein O N-terminal domain-containing protein [Lentisphaeria bacterium]